MDGRIEEGIDEWMDGQIMEVGGRTGSFAV